MKPVIFASLAFALAAGGLAVHAQETLSPGQKAAKAQLAAGLNVDPDDFTTMELVQMKCIMEGSDSDAEKARLLAAVKGFGDWEEPSATDKAQLAASLGVDPAEYTLDELSLLKSMLEDDECDIADPAAYVKGREQLTEATASAKSQLAAGLGVSPIDYTLAELVRMKVKAEEEN